MHKNFLSLLTCFIALIVTLLTGCATDYKNIIHIEKIPVDIKKIAVTQYSDQELYPIVIAYQSKNIFGLLGSSIETAYIKSKTQSINESLKSNGLKIADVFYEKMHKELSANEYQINPVIFNRDIKFEAMRDELSKVQGQDASMILRVSAAYYAQTKESDYFPSVYVYLEFVDHKRSRTVYRNFYQYGFNWGNQNGQYFNAANNCRFKDMNAIAADIDKSRKCLTDGIDILVKQIATDLRK